MKNESKSESPLIGEPPMDYAIKEFERLKTAAPTLKDALYLDGVLAVLDAARKQFKPAPAIGERSAEDEQLAKDVREAVKNDDVAMWASDEDRLYYEHFFHKGIAYAKAKEDSLPEATEKTNAYKWIASLVMKHQMSVEDWNLGPMSKRNYRAIHRQIEQHNESLKEVAIQLKRAFEESKEDNKAFGEQDLKAAFEAGRDAVSFCDGYYLVYGYDDWMEKKFGIPKPGETAR